MHKAFVISFVMVAASGSALAADTVEVVHRWTTPGEAHAVTVLKAELARGGITWTDMAVPGGEVNAQITTLRNRVVTKDPPTAAMMFGAEVQEWGKLGAMADLSQTASQEGWDKFIPRAVQDSAKYQGKWVAVPVTLNIYNTLFASKAVLDRAGVTAMPDSWDSFIAAMDKVKQKGLIGFAMSGKSWEIGVIFEGVALATGGKEFHRKAFGERDKAVLGSDTMKRAFDRMSQLRKYTDAAYPSRDWSAATALLIQEKAAFQLMGSWAKGEFTNAGKLAGRDFLCAPTPGTRGTVMYSSDLLGMFNLSSGGFRKVGAEQAQSRFASLLMSARVQSAFNVAKGSLPARLDIPETSFDACARQAMKDVVQAQKNNTLILPMTRQVPDLMRRGFLEVIDQQFNGKLSSTQAAAAMAAVID